MPLSLNVNWELYSIMHQNDFLIFLRYYVSYVLYVWCFAIVHSNNFIFTVHYNKLFTHTVHAISTFPNSAIAIFPTLNAEIKSDNAVCGLL